jgi:hypothetical protein
VKDATVFWLRLQLQAISSVATTVAAGAITFELLGKAVNHDIESLSLLVATACNTVLLGLATYKDHVTGLPPGQ